jgi:hypothetical protein
VELHLAEVRATSSVHAPNLARIQVYQERHWRPRVTQHTVRVACTDLDTIVQREGLELDFLKVDTQGCEHEVLEGFHGASARMGFGITLETWTIEVHAGQRLTSDVMALAQELGYELFGVQPAATWRRAAAAGTLLQREQVTGLDLLYLKRVERLLAARPSIATVLKAAAIADVWGFPDYAIEVLREADRALGIGAVADRWIATILRRRAVRTRRRRGRELVRRALARIGVPVTAEFPSLH